MLIEELDGFLAAILVCPHMIPPSAWLPLVRNSEGGEEPVFADLQHLTTVMGLVMDHYNRIASTLFDKPDDYAPLFAVDQRNSDVLWNCGSRGSRRRSSFAPILGADLDTVRAW